MVRLSRVQMAVQASAGFVLAQVFTRATIALSSYEEIVTVFLVKVTV